MSPIVCRERSQEPLRELGAIPTPSRSFAPNAWGCSGAEWDRGPEKGSILKGVYMGYYKGTITSGVHGDRD